MREPAPKRPRAQREYHEKHMPNASLLANSRAVQARGLAAFVSDERQKYVCSACGEIISLHDGVCGSCGAPMAAVK